MHSNGQPGVQGRADTMSVCLCVQKQSLESSGCLYTLWLKHSAQEIVPVENSDLHDVSVMYFVAMQGHLHQPVSTIRPF